MKEVRVLEGRTPTPLVEIVESEHRAMGVKLLLKRDDLIHPSIPGNKWRKLVPSFREAAAGHHDTVLTFGGAFSNHIYAVANAAELAGLRSIGLIRGEEHLPLNPVLEQAQRVGMELHYIDRDTYRRKDTPAFLATLPERFGAPFVIPEGGSSPAGVRGVADVVGEIDRPFDVICCPCGTGGTLAGLASALPPHARAVGVAVLKGAGFLTRDVSGLLTAVGSASSRWEVLLDYHFGGFARATPELLAFIDDFEEKHGVGLDPIYTGKMMYALYDCIERRRFEPGTRIVALHTGGVPRDHWAGLVPAEAPASTP